MTVAARAGIPQTVSASAAGPSTFIELLRSPDGVVAFADLKHGISLRANGAAWMGQDIVVHAEPDHARLPLFVSAPVTRLTHLQVRWKAKVSEELIILGDQWERSYGDLGWRTMVPDRVLPWYFQTYDKRSLHGYGVKTAAGALCFWQIDPDGVSLWLNVSNGGEGVALGGRRLLAATVVTRRGEPGENSMFAARAFCRRMCDTARVAAAPLYSSNDWYYAYGKNSADGILRDADMVASCAPRYGPRPFTIIDDGWQRKETFPDMRALAAQIRTRNVRPGIWIRPLQAAKDAPQHSLLPAQRYGERKDRYGDCAYDPTTEYGLQSAVMKVKQAVDWGYELVKHDFSTYELLGRWGSEMGAYPTTQGWHFQDQSRTTAEIILDFYQVLRKAAGQTTLLIGCNTVGHLSAGVFDVQRTGDDVSGKDWERTRRMGVNTLAFRLPQNGSFFMQDADCVPITQAVAWSQTRQWLDLVTRSGTTLLISAEPAAVKAEQRSSITEAFASAASGDMQGEPEDPFASTTPNRWRFTRGMQPEAAAAEQQYDWCEPQGAWPFEI